MAIEQGTVDVTRDIQKRTNPSSIDKIFMINPYTNEVQYIEQGQITNKVMSDMRPEIEAIKNAAFFGHASLSTVPNIELGPQFYIASQEGTYPEFGGLTVDMSDGLNMLSFDGSAWTKILVPIELGGYALGSDLLSYVRETTIRPRISEVISEKVEGYSNIPLFYPGPLDTRRYTGDEAFTTSPSDMAQADEYNYNVISQTGTSSHVVYFRTGIAASAGRYSFVFVLKDGSGGVGIGWESGETGAYRGLLLANGSGNLYYTSPHTVSVQVSGAMTYEVDDLIRIDVEGTTVYLYKNNAFVSQHTISDSLSGELSIVVRGQLEAEVRKISRPISVTPEIASFQKVQALEQEVQEMPTVVDQRIVAKIQGGFENDILGYTGELNLRRYTTNIDYITATSSASQDDMGTHDMIAYTGTSSHVVYFRTGIAASAGRYSFVFVLKDGSGGVGIGWESGETGAYRGLLLANGSGNLYYTSPHTVSVQVSGAMTYEVDDLIRIDVEGTTVYLYKNNAFVSQHTISDSLSGELSIVVRGQLEAEVRKIEILEEILPEIASYQKVQALEQEVEQIIEDGTSQHLLPYPLFPLPKNPETLKILCIGNSFSIDMLQHIPRMLDIAGVDNVRITNMVITGGTLEDHWNKLTNDLPDYTRYTCEQGSTTWQTQSSRRLFETILSDNWDLIVFQQQSSLSGVYESTQPYLNRLIREVKINSINAGVSIGWHSTWAFSSNTSRPGWSEHYQSDQDTMYEAIVDVAKKVAKNTGVDVIIPSGTVIQNLRKINFDPSANEMTRDTYHLDQGAGRYAAACAFFQAIIAPVFGLSVNIDQSFTTTEGSLPVTPVNRATIQKAAVFGLFDRFETSDI